MSRKQAFVPSIENSLETKYLMSGLGGGPPPVITPVPVVLAPINVTEPAVVSRQGGTLVLSETTFGLGTPTEQGLLDITVTLTDTDNNLVVQTLAGQGMVSGSGADTTTIRVNFGNLMPGNYSAQITAADGSQQGPGPLSTYVPFNVPEPTQPTGVIAGILPFGGTPPPGVATPV